MQLRELNYHHLRYFWVVAREGSIAKACVRLHLAQPTISGQLRELEEAIGDQLFVRTGRNLALTDTGRLVLGYCDEIFALGNDLAEALAGRSATGRPVRLAVGISDEVPKMVAHRLIEPALRIAESVRLVCHEDRFDRLLGELAVGGYDALIADQPISGRLQVKAYSHLLGESGITVFATADRAGLARGFPQSLAGQPFLLPLHGSALRLSLEQWFDTVDVHPAIAGEFQDSALIKAFGQAGHGAFAGPTVLEDEIIRQYDVRPLGRIASVRERYYIISVERRLSNPAVLAIRQAGRQILAKAG